MGLAAAIGVGAVASVAGGVISSSGAKSAANASAAASDRASQVQQQIYGENKQLMQPFVNTGTAAMGNINALLGISPTQPAAAPTQPGATGMTGGLGVLGGLGGMIAPRPATTPTTGTVNTAQPTQPTAQQAFDTYRNSTGYQFRVGQGMDAINSGYAGAGTLQSGAAMRAISDYGQGMASQEFGNYMNALGNQQALGFSGASAVAGVGQNYANNLGSIYQQNGANQANAALAGANAMGNSFNNIGNLAGSVLGRNSMMGAGGGYLPAAGGIVGNGTNMTGAIQGF